jgi:hypothetical protein
MRSESGQIVSVEFAGVVARLCSGARARIELAQGNAQLRNTLAPLTSGVPSCCAQAGIQ